MTSEPMRRTADAHVHFFRAGLAQIDHARPCGSSADNRIVHDDDALSSNGFPNQIQFHPHIEIANQLTRLQKSAADVMVSHKGVLVRDVQFVGKAECGIVS